MKLFQTLFILLLSVLFISCGESTTSSPIADVASISLDDRNITIRSTDSAKVLTATATYTDGSTANATADLAWNSSDYTLLFSSVGSVIASKNGGDANLSIEYADTFEDSTTVHIKELLKIEYSDINVSDTGTAQTVLVSGIFKNEDDSNETGAPLEANIKYYYDANATITDINATQFTFTINNDTNSTLIRAVLFDTLNNEQDFNTTFTATN